MRRSAHATKRMDRRGTRDGNPIAGAIGGGVLALAVAATGFAGSARAAEPITIAIAGPMVGTSFSVGVQYKVGVEAALGTLTDGTILGRPIAMTALDDDCRAEIAEKVARDLVESPPAVVIGHSCSAATIAAEPVYASAGVLQITPASTNPKITEMGISTIFRMIGRDDVQGVVAAERIATKHAGKRLGVVRFPTAYSADLTANAIAELEKRGMKPVKVVHSVASQPSYANEVESLMAADVEVLYIVGGALDTAVFMRQAKQLDAPFAVISADTLVSKIFIQTAGEAAEGVPFTFPPDAAKLATSADAVTAIRAKGLEPVGYTLLAYAAIQTWLEGVKRAKGVDSASVAAALRDGPIDTILGPISFDAKGDIITRHAPFAWYAWRDGQRTPID